MTKNKHGANLFELAKKYNFNMENIMDFSSNINPFGASPKALEYVCSNIENVSIYPDPEYKNLINSISLYCQVPAENILLGTGATGLISGFINYIKPKNAMIILPAYSEYEYELNKLKSCNIFFHCLKKENDFRIDIKKLIDDVNKNNIELLIMCSPNNPTGSVSDILCTSQLLSKTSCHVMIDETYVEFTDIKKYSSISLSHKYPKLFVIRSTSKFFAVPGIRLGYGISSNKDFLKQYSLNSELWQINIIASMMGGAMVTDTGFINNTYNKISYERKYLIDSLKQQGAKIHLWGVGTSMITSRDCPAFGGVYKLAAIYDKNQCAFVPKIKISENTEKVTNPGNKKIYRIYHKDNHKIIADLICLEDEIVDINEELVLFDPNETWKKTMLFPGSYTVKEILVPVFKKGKCIYDSPAVMDIQAYCRQELDTLWDESKRLAYPHKIHVDLSQKLWNMRVDLLSKY